MGRSRILICPMCRAVCDEDGQAIVGAAVDENGVATGIQLPRERRTRTWDGLLNNLNNFTDFWLDPNMPDLDMAYRYAQRRNGETEFQFLKRIRLYTLIIMIFICLAIILILFYLEKSALSMPPIPSQRDGR